MEFGNVEFGPATLNGVGRGANERHYQVGMTRPAAADSADSAGGARQRSELGALHFVFDSFAASTDEVANALGISSSQALRLLSALEQRGLVAGLETDSSGWVRNTEDGRAREGGQYTFKTWQSRMTYDNHLWPEVEANARDHGASERAIAEGASPAQRKAQQEARRVTAAASDRQIKQVANAATASFNPFRLLTLSPDELAEEVDTARRERDAETARTLGEEAAARSRVKNLMALQQIQGDREATMAMIGMIYDNRYKRRSPDLQYASKEELGKRLGLSASEIRQSKKQDLVRRLIEEQIGTREGYIEKALGKLDAAAS